MDREQLKESKIKFFEMIVHKLISNIPVFGDFGLQINFLTEGEIFFSKSYKMNQNQKLIKMLDFEEILNPRLSDLYEEKKDKLNKDQKQVFFKKNLYKFNSILSLIEYETSKDYIDNPCYLNGYFRKEPKILGSGNYENCYKLISQVITKLGISGQQEKGQLNSKKLSSVSRIMING